MAVLQIRIDADGDFSNRKQQFPLTSISQLFEYSVFGEVEIHSKDNGVDFDVASHFHHRSLNASSG